MLTQPSYLFSDWPVLSRYLHLGIFSYIDLFFAKRVLPLSGNESQAAVLSVMFALYRQGHLVLNSTDSGLCIACQSLSISDPQELIALLKKGVVDFPAIPSVSQLGCSFYWERNFKEQKAILSQLDALSQVSPRLTLSNPVLDPVLNREQSLAIVQAIHHCISFLTGGPGTGKTFTAAHLVKAILATLNSGQELRIILMAPTGKAAFHLESSLKKLIEGPLTIKTGTLHALLGLKRFQQTKAIPLFADLILIDESSMIDIRLFARLVDSLQPGTRVVFIGDKDQLPPVEAGSIFADLLESHRYPSTVLEECLRSDVQAILSVAKAVKEGNATQAQVLLEHERMFIEIENTDCFSVLKELAQRFGNPLFHLFESEPSKEMLASLSNQIAFLSCIRKGPLGVDAINSYFFKQLLSLVGSYQWMVIPVMITANHYEWGLYNGDQGVLCCKTSSNPVLKDFDQEDYLFFSGRSISPWALSSFTMSYCLSVHKSQGSEYEEVVVVAPPGSESFGREVLYTALTRAKKRVWIASTVELLKKSITSSSRKQSGILSL